MQGAVAVVVNIVQVQVVAAVVAEVAMHPAATVQDQPAHRAQLIPVQVAVVDAE